MASLSELLKQASQNIARIVDMEKRGFTPSAGGAMPPSGATAMPPDPSMMGGAPPMDPSMGGGMPPMDPSMGGGAPPMGDPSMMGAGAGDPAGGPPIVQLGAQDLMQMMQMMQQGGAPAPGGAPGGAGAGKGGAKQAMEAKIDALIGKVDMLIGFFAAQSGMNAQQLLGGGSPPSLGAGGMPAGGEGEEGLIPQMPAEGAEGGGEAAAPPPPEAPPLQPQASVRQVPLAKAGRQSGKPKTSALQLHTLVGKLLQ